MNELVSKRRCRMAIRDFGFEGMRLLTYARSSGRRRPFICASPKSRHCMKASRLASTAERSESSPAHGKAGLSWSLALSSGMLPAGPGQLLLRFWSWEAVLGISVQSDHGRIVFDCPFLPEGIPQLFIRKSALRGKRRYDLALERRNDSVLVHCESKPTGRGDCDHHFVGVSTFGRRRTWLVSDNA